MAHAMQESGVGFIHGRMLATMIIDGFFPAVLTGFPGCAIKQLGAIELIAVQINNDFVTIFHQRNGAAKSCFWAHMTNH
jgi:hypothetical protein